MVQIITRICQEHAQSIPTVGPQKHTHVDNITIIIIKQALILCVGPVHGITVPRDANCHCSVIQLAPFSSGVAALLGELG